MTEGDRPTAEIAESIAALSFSEIDIVFNKARRALCVKIYTAITENRENQHEREVSLRCDKCPSTR
jgi:hypothetical protein